VEAREANAARRRPLLTPEVPKLNQLVIKKQPPCPLPVLRRLYPALVARRVLVMLMMCLMVVMAMVARLMSRRLSDGGIGKQTHHDRDPENLSHNSILTSPDEVARRR
jgi:hypothetical protein